MPWIEYKRRYDPKKEGYGNRDKWRKNFYARFDFKEWREDTSREETSIETTIQKTMRSCKSAEELKTTFRKLVMQYHPDKAGNTPENNYICGYIINLFNKLKYKFK